MELKNWTSYPKSIFQRMQYRIPVIAQYSAVSISGSNSDKVSITAGLDSKLVGEDFVAITKKVYEKVAKRLTDAGFEIVSGEEAGKIDYYKSTNPLYGGTAFLKNGHVYYYFQIRCITNPAD